jgi:spermidine synthase
MSSAIEILHRRFSAKYATENGLIVLFFLSGFSALCYQLVWQRTLFATFGINVESVTIIVSLFMFGLGLGALVGARLERYPRHLLRLFIAFELAIGLFGAISRPTIIWLGSLQHIDSLWTIALYTYVVFAIPTLLMGATLPILVSYINKHVGHAGKSISWLYASNTFGAAIAACVTVRVFFVHWGLDTTILIAVFLNFTAALLAYVLYNRLPVASHVQEIAKAEEIEGKDPINASPAILLALGFLIGYVALSQELVWYRVLGYLSANDPITFGLMLTFFLAGIAISAIKSSRAYGSSETTVNYIFAHLVGLLLTWFIAFPLIAAIAASAGKAVALLAGLLLTGLVAYLSGGIFPVLCHLFQAQTRQSAGTAVGKLYFANVMGATIGPLFTGFVLFEYCSLETSVLLIGLLTAGIALFLVARANLERNYQFGVATACLLITALGLGLHYAGYDRFFEKLQFGGQSEVTFETFHSNRNGIIGVSDTSVYGNGAYDGKMNLDPHNDTNGIVRAHAIPAFHPNPKRILLIGVSGGSWTQVLSDYKPLEEITAVEINKGYLEVIKQYEDHAGMLDHPKVKMVIDDGRRWVRNNPQEKFDVIVMNTIYHWRSNATNMLSKEFFELCKQRLKPGGFVFVNNTGAKEVAFTAAHVFDYVSVAFEGKMAIAGDTASNVDKQTRIDNMKQFVTPDGSPVFLEGSVMDAIVEMPFPNHREDILRQEDLLVITDDNMATEFKKSSAIQ